MTTVERLDAYLRYGIDITLVGEELSVRGPAAVLPWALPSIRRAKAELVRHLSERERERERMQRISPALYARLRASRPAAPTFDVPPVAAPDGSLSADFLAALDAELGVEPGAES